MTFGSTFEPEKPAAGNRGGLFLSFGDARRHPRDGSARRAHGASPSQPLDRGGGARSMVRVPRTFRPFRSTYRRGHRPWQPIAFTASPSFPATASARKSCRRACACWKRRPRSSASSCAFDDFDFASCDYYEKHGQMMPEDWKEKIGKHDAIYFGAVGMPDRVPDHISLWGSLILFRREFDQYVNLRPVRLMPGVPSPLANRKPGDIDFWVVRENTEGEYSAIGGRMFPGTDREVVHAGDGDDPHRRRPHPEIRLRTRPLDAEEASDLGDQVERHRHHHAVLGRARGGDGEDLSGREVEQVPHRHPDRALRA